MCSPHRLGLTKFLPSIQLRVPVQTHNMMVELFELLEESLDGKKYLLSDAVLCSLDCLAVGYLVLLLAAELLYS